MPDLRQQFRQLGSGAGADVKVLVEHSAGGRVVDTTQTLSEVRQTGTSRASWGFQPAALRYASAVPSTQSASAPRLLHIQRLVRDLLVEHGCPVVLVGFSVAHLAPLVPIVTGRAAHSGCQNGRGHNRDPHPGSPFWRGLQIRCDAWRRC
jgi:hypothetical protein